MAIRHINCKNLKGPKLDKLEYDQRLTAFAGKLKPDSAAIIVSNPERNRSNDTEFPYRQSSDILYLNGFPEPEAVLVLTNYGGKRELTMFVRPRDKQSETWNGRREGTAGAVKNYLADVAYEVGDLEETLPELLAPARHVYYRFGVNPDFDEIFRGCWEQNQSQALLNPEDILHEMRLFKSEAELEMMRHSAAISAEAHVAAMKASAPGLMEYQLQAVIEGTFLFHGASFPAYTSIVAGGNNANVLHYVENTARLRNNTLVLIDAGSEYRGYAADITRTFPVNGKFTKPQRELYEIVLEAQLAGIQAARPGVELRKVHLAAQVALAKGLVRLGILPRSALTGDYLNRYGKGQYKGKKARLHLLDLFMHGTSHWLGIDVHDVGRYQSEDGTRSDKGRGKQRVLKPGMVITAEPGLYIPHGERRVPRKYRGIGIRIEDDVAITKDGNEVLSADVPKSVDEIEALMSGQ